MKERFGSTTTHSLGSTSVAVFGHRVYIRKCKRKPHTFAADDGRILEIIEHDRVEDYCHWHMVMAIGDKVGTRREFKDKWDREKKADAVKHLVAEFGVGDRVLVLKDHWGTRSSPWSKYEYFVDETAILAVECDGD